MNDIEMCGILSGQLIHGTYKITHLLIPKRTASPNSCTTEEGETIFEYQNHHDDILFFQFTSAEKTV